MAGAARFRLLHVCHGVLLFLLYVKDGIVADAAVIIVFFQVEIVAEDNRFSVFKREGYVLCLLGL